MAKIKNAELSGLLRMAIDRALGLAQALDGGDNPQNVLTLAAARASAQAYQEVLDAINGQTVLLRISAGL